ncbi:hypothetical protein PTTG_28938 [Puccinia triticina 1-1 BBBD Race 1]|uniref:Uncharacterized protein n=2 Tax=Puccinia triticina TaxID=208348 RepID=A0A180G8S0_PUCT1|nr:uncharacterized protein PtA15_1A636 [Puccinia triticina]OAV88722.1 hypothetical protein PTTG_28938 [Puccinia triticina 1-1 BBBD Race 1]WAQ81296.1 hypothetical protein PtA15_1A636 [Puccinia triticina]
MPNNFEDNCYDMLQDHDDFMLPSLSQIDQWLADDIQQGGSPISIIQTSEQSNLPPSATKDQQLGKEDTDLARDGKHGQQVDDEKIKINVEYKFFFIIPEDKPTNPRQKKRKASNNEEKCKPLPSTPGLVHFDWDADVKNLGAFKKAAIKAIGLLDDEEVAADVMEHATEQEDDGEIIWSATIPHGGRFANKNKATLTDNDDLSDFLDECKGPREGRRFTITMIQKDPKISAQKQKIVKSFKKKHRPQPEEEDEEPEPSGGAVSSATIMKNIRELRAAHEPCEELSGSAEVPVFINPSNPKEYIKLTTDRLFLWARAMADNPEVTVTKPPPSDSFAFTTKEKRLKIAKSQNSDDGPITP